MRLKTLSDPILLIEQHMNSSRIILRESCEGLTKEQRYIVEGIYNEFKPLIEASLTSDQIKDIFQQIEKTNIEGGQSRTLAGKGVDTAKKANEIINNIGRWLQNTKPVQGFDAKFDQLKDTINKKFPDSKILDGVSDLAIWVKDNPGKSAAVIGVLTAIAALAAGPVGGAIAGQVLRGSAELLKGEKLSTAIGKGLKTAAVGWLAGMTMDKVGDMISNVYRQLNPIPVTGYSQYYQFNVGNGLPNIMRNAELYGSEEQLSQFKGMWGEAVKQWNRGDFEGAREAFSQAQDFASKVSMETMNKIAIEGDPAEKIRALNQALDGFAAAAQGAASGATAYDKQGKPVGKESYYIQQRPLSEGQVYLLFNRVLTEAGFLDKIKAGAGRAASAVAKGAAWAGKQATEQVTSAKLLAAWKLEGSPTDSEELKKFLLNFGGIDAKVIDQVYSDMKLSTSDDKTDTAAAAGYKEIKAMIQALDKKGRQRIMAHLQKQLGTP